MLKTFFMGFSIYKNKKKSLLIEIESTSNSGINVFVF